MPPFTAYPESAFHKLQEQFPRLDLNRLHEKMTAYRRHFHRFPEVSLKEFKTSEYIETILKQAGYRPVRVTETGLCALLWKGEAYPTIAVRAEMDALPVTEATGLPFSSVRPGVMHACGHDGILAVALALAELMAEPEHRERLRYNIKFIFQPAEEAGNGTKLMMDAGVLEDPHVDEMIIFHFVTDHRPGIDIQERVASATLGKVEIEVQGVSTHWGAYETGIDAIHAAALAVAYITEINRHYPLPRPFALGIGTIQGGTGRNIVADSVRLSGTMRAQEMEDYEELSRVLKERLADIEKETGTRILLSLSDRPTPSIINDRCLVAKALEAGAYVFGPEHSTLSHELFLSGDNAALFFQKTRGVFIIFMAPNRDGSQFPFHNPRFDFGEDVFPFALCTLYRYLTTEPAETPAAETEAPADAK